MSIRNLCVRPSPPWPLRGLVVLALTLAAWPLSAAPKLTAVTLETKPAGAEIVLLEPAPERPLGTSPLQKVKLPQGPVKLRLRLAGYEDKVEVVTVGAAESVFSFELVRKKLPAMLDLGGDASAQGAEVVVDGEVKGRLPLKLQVADGKHLVVVRKAGFVQWERWVELAENQAATFDIVLRAAERPKGSMLLSSSPPSAEVRVSGSPRGKTPQLIENLLPGSYEVEMTLEQHKPWRQSVVVREGQRETVSAVLEPLAASGGDLLVLCDAPLAVLWVDGVARGPSPAKVAGLAPGDHVVECRADGAPPQSQVVAVRAGETRSVQFDMRQAAAASRGAIAVTANVATARARVGDGDWKKLPAQFNDLAVGNYQLAVEAEGYATETATVTVEAQKTAEWKVTLQAVGKIQVRVPLGRRAKVYIDGAIRGAAPLTEVVAVGPHKVKIVEEGVAAPLTEEVDVAVVSGQVATVQAQFAAPPPPRLVRRSNPTSAHVNDIGKGTVQFGVGAPVIGQVAVMAGVSNDVAAGVDIGLSGMINEFVLTGGYRLVGTRAFALGVQAGLGGGLGPSDRKSFTVHIKPMASLLLGDSSSFTVYAQARYFSDKFPVQVGGKSQRRDDSGFLLPVGMQAEFQISPSFNMWAKFEMDFVRPGARDIYNDPLDPLNGEASGAIGVTWLPN